MLSLQQLPQALYSGLSLVSSSAGPDSVTSPTVGYNIIPSDIPSPPLTLLMDRFALEKHLLSYLTSFVIVFYLFLSQYSTPPMTHH